ncbi:hypothetical protein [Streptomyces sp. NPDC048438]|uniref:hypothetical protein n=1 Tax=Streptomyces sp. NPDC048438 TaxID=3365551 RepID=UPI003720D5C9
MRSARPPAESSATPSSEDIRVGEAGEARRAERGKVAQDGARPQSDPFLAEAWSDLPEKRKGWLSFVHNEQVFALLERVRDTVLGGPDPAAIPVDELSMAVPAAEVEVSGVFTGKERRAHKQAFEALAARYDGVVPGLRKALRDSYLSSRAVGRLGSVSSGPRCLRLARGRRPSWLDLGDC